MANICLSPVRQIWNYLPNKNELATNWRWQIFWKVEFNQNDEGHLYYATQHALIPHTSIMSAIFQCHISVFSTIPSWMPFSNVIYQCSLQFHHECPFPMSYISVLYNSITNALFQCHISVFPTIPSWMPFSNVISHFINSIMNTCCQCHIPISQTIRSWISFPMLYVSFSYNSIMNALFLVLFQ